MTQVNPKHWSIILNAAMPIQMIGKGVAPEVVFAGEYTTQLHVPKDGKKIYLKVNGGFNFAKAICNITKAALEHGATNHIEFWNN